MWIVKNRRKFFALTLIYLAISLLLIFALKPRLGIDFTGGDIYRFETKSETQVQELKEKITQIGISKFSLRETEKDGKIMFVLRTKPLDDKSQKQLEDTLKSAGAKIEQHSFVGPAIGKELTRKAAFAITLTVIMIIVFIAFAFREVSKPVSSFYYGLVATLALLHDILVPVAVFSVLSAFFGAEIDSLFVMALLAILGYSVNDTIVIFDRVRERLKINAKAKKKEKFEETVGRALESSLARSINTSLTTAFVLLSLVLFGADSTRFFALTLLAGTIAGTYSSVFLAAPALVEINELLKKKANKDKKD